MMETTLKLEEIAKLAGVSKSTVSSVLNGKAEKYRISTETQARVLEVVNHHGYQPNHSAAALRRGRSHSIGFIVPDFENRSYLRIAKRLEALARSNGFQLIISSSDDDRTTELQAARNLVARGVDALLVSSCVDDDAELYGDMVRQGTPVIALDRPLPDSFSNVISDDEQGAFELTSSLKLPGNAHVALFGALPSLTVSQRREAGFRRALERLPAQQVHCFYGAHFDSSNGIQLLDQAVNRLGKLPDALVTTSYSLLEGVVENLQQRAEGNVLQADGSIQLATFGNSRLLDFLPLPVNSLPQRYELIAEAAWKLASEAIDGSREPQQIVINRILQRRA